MTKRMCFNLIKEMLKESETQKDANTECSGSYSNAHDVNDTTLFAEINALIMEAEPEPGAST